MDQSDTNLPPTKNEYLLGYDEGFREGLALGADKVLEILGMNKETLKVLEQLKKAGQSMTISLSTHNVQPDLTGYVGSPDDDFMTVASDKTVGYVTAGQSNQTMASGMGQTSFGVSNTKSTSVGWSPTEDGLDTKSE